MHNIAGYELKWLYEDSLEDVTQAYGCPADVSQEVQKLIEETSLKAYNALQAKDAARIDYRLSDTNQLYFIEINTLPGINPAEGIISYFPLAARTSGLSYSDTIEAIINNALKRYSEQ